MDHSSGLFHGWGERLRELGAEAKRTAQRTWGGAGGGSSVMARRESVPGARAFHFVDAALIQLNAVTNEARRAHRQMELQRAAAERAMRGLQDMAASWMALAGVDWGTAPGGDGAVNSVAGALLETVTQAERMLGDEVLRLAEKRLRLRVLRPMEEAMSQLRGVVRRADAVLEQAQRLELRQRQAEAQRLRQPYAPVEDVGVADLSSLPIAQRQAEVESCLRAHGPFGSEMLAELMEIQQQFYCSAAHVFKQAAAQRVREEHGRTMDEEEGARSARLIDTEAAPSAPSAPSAESLLRNLMVPEGNLVDLSGLLDRGEAREPRAPTSNGGASPILRPRPSCVPERSSSPPSMPVSSRECASDEAAYERVAERVRQWTRDGSRCGNIRSLLGTLHEVVGDDCGWQREGMHNLIGDASVQVAYRRAILLTHPDRAHRNAALNAEQQLLFEKVFDVLRAAHQEFMRQTTRA
ncbi:hypothetical protein CDCA_CDCA15G3937 [Cyanidium caldarium]|uniref:J domain-containing protein n=1 Tax=Cyanidium caldarium TaxID=2771 RepID=A0AAV9J005_CYACA|nr:hypothetical protein CDCA_CDCA15G3937 [Cyanidium caldarium]